MKIMIDDSSSGGGGNNNRDLKQLALAGAHLRNDVGGGCVFYLGQA